MRWWFEELDEPPFRVLVEGEACRTFREGMPYGRTELLGPEEQRAQRSRLSTREMGHSLRRAAYERFRKFPPTCRWRGLPQAWRPPR